ncbi:MAG TPA: hypothetical protein DD381_03015 [Lentisphaeria bacterium]|nr:MAG: hypothetical protein A2X47_03235 [Lentisphaerae bacterium GWF2_38_69]HBM15304.1 hypothetical protein [Lentisphaeria bacterium]
MFIDGLKLMITGMGTVFIFLGLMILIIILLSKLLAPYASILKKEENILPQNQELPENSTSDRTLISAITVAVHKFREKRIK